MHWNHSFPLNIRHVFQYFRFYLIKKNLSWTMAHGVEDVDAFSFSWALASGQCQRPVEQLTTDEPTCFQSLHAALKEGWVRLNHVIRSTKMMGSLVANDFNFRVTGNLQRRWIHWGACQLSWHHAGSGHVSRLDRIHHVAVRSCASRTSQQYGGRMLLWPKGEYV